MNEHVIEYLLSKGASYGLSDLVQAIKADREDIVRRLLENTTAKNLPKQCREALEVALKYPLKDRDSMVNIIISYRAVSALPMAIIYRQKVDMLKSLDRAGIWFGSKKANLDIFKAITANPTWDNCGYSERERFYAKVTAPPRPRTGPVADTDTE